MGVGEISWLSNLKEKLADEASVMHPNNSRWLAARVPASMAKVGALLAVGLCENTWPGQCLLWVATCSSSLALSMLAASSNPKYACSSLITSMLAAAAWRVEYACSSLISSMPSFCRGVVHGRCRCAVEGQCMVVVVALMMPWSTCCVCSVVQDYYKTPLHSVYTETLSSRKLLLLHHETVEMVQPEERTGPSRGTGTALLKLHGCMAMTAQHCLGAQA
jgi:hypothetical protein